MEINSENSTLYIQVPRHKIKWKICKAKRRKEDSENPRKTSRFAQLKTILIMLDEREFAAKYLPKNVRKLPAWFREKSTKDFSDNVPFHTRVEQEICLHERKLETYRC